MDLRATQLIVGGLASNSRRSYYLAATRYLNFCDLYSLDPFNISESTVLRFISYLSSSFIAPSTIKVYLSGVRAWVITNGGPPPLIYSQRVRWALKCLERVAPPPVRVNPFTFDMFLIISEHLTYSYDNVFLYCSMLLGYFGCLRAAEYLPSAGSPPLLPSHFKLHLAPVPYYIINIQSSKTAQKGFSLVVGCSGSGVCAVCWLRHCFQIRTLPPSLPFFSFHSGAPITRSALAAFMQRSLARAGRDASGISPHSLRAGSATDAAGLGASDSAIQRLGRWRSSAYTAYIRPAPLQQASMANWLASAHRHPATN